MTYLLRCIPRRLISTRLKLPSLLPLGSRDVVWEGWGVGLAA